MALRMRKSWSSCLAVVVLAACSSIACGGMDRYDDEETEELAEPMSADKLPATFERVVLGRVYQHHWWTVPAADAYQPDVYPDLFQRRVAYVCNALASLKPTLVSGLLRLDGSEQLLEEQRLTYRAIRVCVRDKVNHPVRFDIVLNALHYTDPAVFPTSDEAAQALKARLEELRVAIGPDIWFFDFFSVPWNDEHVNWHRGALQAGIKWIHDHHGVVGGNVWGMNAPPGSDFAALDNFDRGNIDGMTFVEKQTEALGDMLPLLMHIENNPQKPGSKGLLWLHGSYEYRKDVLAKHASHQKDWGYRYMYPAYFPLEIVGDSRVAYDVKQDENMLGVMRHKMDQYD